MESFKDRLLSYYELTSEDFARLTHEPSLAFLPALEGEAVDKAKRRILKAVEGQEKTLIYGDYDTDGIMATSILFLTLKQLGLRSSYFIPSRYEDGYGLTLEAAKRIADAHYSLVILVDNGVSCLDEISFLRSKGIDVIVIDHHALPADLPPSFALIHHETLHYGTVPVSAGYLSFAFSRVLLEKDDDYLLTLGAISIVSDLMPMKDHNRVAVALALRNIRAYAYPEITFFTEDPRIDEKTLGLEVIPTINAVGRMDNGNKNSRLVRFFGRDCTKENALDIALWMKQNNADRKAATSAAENRLRIEKDEPGVCAIGLLPEGLNGLLANRIMNKTDKPTAIFSPSSREKDEYVGSLRCKEGFSVLELESLCEDIIVRGGGHAHAGGLTIKKDDYGEFRKRFLSYCASHPHVKTKEKAIPLEKEEITMENFRLIRLFAPFGMEYKEPRFALTLKTEELRFSRDERFLSMILPNGSKLFSFAFGKMDIDFRKENIEVVGTFSLRYYRGVPELTLLCELA